MKIRWCVIGAGGIADRRTIPALLEDSNNELVAVMDMIPAVAEKVGNKYGVKYFSSEKEMLDSVDCDAVYIATPVFKHYEQATLALSYDKHVFVEKPVCMTAKDGAELVKAFKEKGKQFTVGYMMKYHNLHKKAKEIIKADGIGEPNNIRAQFSCWYPDIEGAWRQKKALGGGGAVMDLAVHAIELIEDILEENIVEVKSFYSTKTFKYEVEDSAVIIFRTISGVLGHIDVNFNIPDVASVAKLEIYGEKGYIICSNTLAQEEKGTLSYLYSPQGDYVDQQNRVLDKSKKYYGKKGNLYLKQIRAFAKILRSGKNDYYFAERAVQVQEIVDKIYAE